MKLPTQQQCLDYFDEYKVPANIKAHCLKVQEVAVFIAKELREVGVDVNVELVRAASLLHDLFKVVKIDYDYQNKYHSNELTEEERAMWTKLRASYPGMHESEVAYEIFKDEFPELALALKREGDPYVRDRVIEESIILHADYRLMRTEIVSLAERLAYLREMYKTPEFWDDFGEYCKQEEVRIFAKLPFGPEELKTKVEQSQQ